MYPILYENITSGSVPTSFGIGVLKDAISCEVKEERNGEYELTLKYPSSGAYASYLLPRAVLKVKPNFTDDLQLFRIYKVGKSIGSSFTVNARHISYDLSGFPITTGSASNVGDALQLLQNAATGYTFTTDKSLTANFKIHTPSSVRSWLGGKEGSILDLYGPGDYKYNNFNIQFLTQRGQDRGVTVRYGKNLTKLDSTNDSSNVVTGIMAYWQSAEDTPTTVCSNVIPTGVTLDVGVVSVIDASEKYETEPTVAQLDAYVNSYITNHQVTQVKKNIKLDFLQIATLKDRVDLCDTVHVIYEDYGINVTAKCISTTWDVLNEKYIEIELGEPKTNIADTISNISKAVSDVMTANQVQQAINDATELITGNKGGYVILHDSDQDGFPDELLIMNTADVSTATKVWRWNLSGLGYSSNGYSGPFGLAMTMDGAIVADYIKTGNLVFGGSGNTDGKLEIRDTQGNLICRFDKTGANVKGNITAESFDANAGDGNSYEILTGDTTISMLGRLSGIIGYNSANEGMTGLAHKYTRTAGNDYHYTSAAYAKDPKKDSYAYMRYVHDVTPSAGTIDDMAEVGGLYTDGSNYAHSHLQAGYLSNLHADVSGNIESSGSVAGTYNLGVSKSGNTTTGSFGIFTGDSHISGNTSSDGPTGLAISNTSTNKIYLNGSSGNITCVSLTQTSSKKYKKKIKTLKDEEAKKILELRPVIYDFKDEEMGTNMRGFIAEEVDEVIPELVKHTKDYSNPISTVDEDGNEVAQEQAEDEVSLDYTAMIPYLTKMVQLQQKQIDDQQKQINDLKNEINKLKGEC